MHIKYTSEYILEYAIHKITREFYKSNRVKKNFFNFIKIFI